ncbi:MAG: hypothetical protein COB35_02070 [Gammaproteobacteria bacterium]|nr:MAG: hypothetical protein COB35_02070 [Gammaproteobacteria bacterium]
MSFFKKIFNKSTDEQRKLNSPSDLTINDIIVLSDSFGLPENLRAQQFQVTAVNTYEFETNNQTEWVLKNSQNDQLYLTLDIDDEVYLKFSLEIEEDDVESLFDLDDFSLIFDEESFEGDQPAILTRQQDSETTNQWSSEQYKQGIFAQVGFFHRKDSRNETLSAYEGKDAGEQFELYQLLDSDESRGIDVEVWSDGDTDVFLTLYRPLTDIVDMYPGS